MLYCPKNLLETLSFSIGSSSGEVVNTCYMLTADLIPLCIFYFCEISSLLQMFADPEPINTSVTYNVRRDHRSTRTFR